MVRPPIKNPITAMSDPICNWLKPVIACPDVQPPAYLVPKPTKNPPIESNRIENNVLFEFNKSNISVGK